MWVICRFREEDRREMADIESVVILMRLLLVSNRLWVMCRFLEEDRKEMADIESVADIDEAVAGI